MNREIEFRGKRVDTGEWVYGFYRKNTFYNKLGDEPKEIYTKHFIGSFSNLELFDNIFEQVEVIPETIGQFIGQFVFNEQKIYEGDILKYLNPYSKKWYEHIVKWDWRLSCFGLFEKNNEWCKESDWLKIEIAEITNNIHDLPQT